MINILINNSEKEGTFVSPVNEVLDDIELMSRVILFNDEWHTFDEVINQIIKAVKCSHEEAEKYTWEVHTQGKSCVYNGAISECVKVSAVLEEIALHTQIEC